MRGWILAAALASTPPAAIAAAPDPEGLALARQVAEASGGVAAVETNMRIMAQALAKGFIAGAEQRGEPVDEETIAAVARAQAEADKPLFVEAIAGAYAQAYTAGELGQLLAYYRSPAAGRGALAAGLAAKTGDLDRRRAANMAPIGGKLFHDVFTDYCAKAYCSEHTREMAGVAPPEAPPQ